MNKNQNQISTGLRVGEASHNASYWSIADADEVRQRRPQRCEGLHQAVEGDDRYLHLGARQVADLPQQDQGRSRCGSQPGADHAKIQTEFNANIEGMKSAANSASFNGQNWLARRSGDVSDS